MPIGPGDVDARPGKGDTRLHADATASSAGFSGRYKNADATIRWSASNAEGYSVSVDSTSDADVHVAHAFTARIRNGSFL